MDLIWASSLSALPGGVGRALPHAAPWRSLRGFWGGKNAKRTLLPVGFTLKTLGRGPSTQRVRLGLGFKVQCLGLYRGQVDYRGTPLDRKHLRSNF